MSERGLRGVDSRNSGADLVTFETDPHGNPLGTPAPAEEIYEPPANLRFTATPPPPTRSVTPAPPREVMRETPRPSDLRRAPQEREVRPSGRRLFLVLGAVALIGLGCTGIAAVGAGMAWMSVQPVAAPEPVEVVPAEPEAPPEVGGIPLEKGLRRGPAQAPSRPDAP